MQFGQIIPIEKLVPYIDNDRTISKQNLTLLKDKLERKKQFKPFFVTPNDLGQYIVLAGNMRLLAYQELGVPEVWCSVLEFTLDKDGLVHVTRDGEAEVETFKSVADAMKDWSLSDNEEFGEYDRDELVNKMDGYNLDWSRYLVSTKRPQSVSVQLQKYLLTDKMENKDEAMTKCPNCGHLFSKKTNAKSE